MDFTLSAAQQARHDHTVQAFRDLPEGPPADRWRFLGKQGLLGACLPAADGGQGLTALDTALLFEAAGEACPDTGLLFAAGAHLFACAMPIARFGSPAQRAQLPALGAGELIAANAITEEEAGSDISRLATTATPAAGGYLLNGAKAFVTNAPLADLHLVYATTDPGAGPWGITAFLIPAITEGLHVGEPFDKPGMSGATATTLTLTDCFVDDTAVLGEPGQGSEVFRHSMTWERTCLFAIFLGAQQRLLDQALAHAQSRRQFNRRLTDFQAVSHRLADACLRLESARLLLYRAACSLDAGRPSPLHTALSKLATSEGFLTTATDTLRLFGHRAYQAGHPAAAAVPDALATTLFSGTSDIQRELIAQELLHQAGR